MSELQQIVLEAIQKCNPHTQYRLHKVIGVSEATVSDWVHGKTKPRGENLLKLQKLINQKGNVAVKLLMMIIAGFVLYGVIEYELAQFGKKSLEIINKKPAVAKTVYYVN